MAHKDELADPENRRSFSFPPRRRSFVLANVSLAPAHRPSDNSSWHFVRPGARFRATACNLCGNCHRRGTSRTRQGPRLAGPRLAHDVWHTPRYSTLFPHAVMMGYPPPFFFGLLTEGQLVDQATEPSPSCISCRLTVGPSIAHAYTSSDDAFFLAGGIRARGLPLAACCYPRLYAPQPRLKLRDKGSPARR